MFRDLAIHVNIVKIGRKERIAQNPPIEELGGGLNCVAAAYAIKQGCLCHVWVIAADSGRDKRLWHRAAAISGSAPELLIALGANYGGGL